MQRTGSLSASARELRVTPSQISKAIARLEGHASARLLTRGAQGARLTEAGRRIAPSVAEAVARIRAIVPGEVSAVTIAAPSYALAAVVPALARSDASLRLRTLELPPAQIRALFAEDTFDVAVLPGVTGQLPASWMSAPAGTIRKVLLGPPELAASLAPLPATPERVARLSFVGPVHRPRGPFSAVRDDCPLPESERRVVHEVGTIGLALELAATARLLVFGPWPAGKAHVDAGRLVEIPVRGWHVTEPVHVVCHAHRVTSRLRGAVLRAVRATLT